VKVLVVGDGALGQVLGLRLAIGGASVSYLVKSGRAGWGPDGRTLYRLRRLGKPVAQQLRPHGVHSEITDGRWDMVWLCVPSTALREPWLYRLRDAVGTATVVSIGQDLHDRAVLANIWTPEQIVQVAPAVLAYSAPLVTEVPATGIAYWTPPGTVTKVSGSADRAFPVVAALRAGHMRARYSGQTGSGELAAALMMPYIAALEAAGWSLSALRAQLGPPAEASREAVAVVTALGGANSPRLRPPAWLVGLVLRLLPRLTPFDLAGYLRAHFTKVAAQTRLMLDGWIAEGESHQLPVTRLRELRRALPTEVTP
jgi:2-dehydropantoate 2-reductase